MSWFIGSLDGSLDGSLVVSLVRWLVGLFVRSLPCSLVGWLVVRFLIVFSRFVGDFPCFLRFIIGSMFEAILARFGFKIWSFRVSSKIDAKIGMEKIGFDECQLPNTFSAGARRGPPSKAG